MFIKEVYVKNIFSRTKVPSAKYVINQYVGCQYACRYCYAKFIGRIKGYGEWGSWIEIKVNAPELVKNKYVDGKVIMSTLSDPYQPIENKYLLTRRILENMNKKISLSILTKSDLITRDIDILKKFINLEVGLTINGYENEFKEMMEPYAPEHRKRIIALKTLKSAGLKTYVFISPILPRITNIEKVIRETMKYSDFYYLEFLNTRLAGYQFIDSIKKISLETYTILQNKEKLLEYISSIMKYIEEQSVKVRDIIYHRKGLARYPLKEYYRLDKFFR